MSPDDLRGWADRRGLILLTHPSGELGLQDPEDPRLLMRFIFRPAQCMLTLALRLDFVVHPTRVAAVDQALSKLNDAAVGGTWVLMHSHGEVFFRYTVPNVGLTFSDEAIDRLVASAFDAVTKAGPRLLPIATSESPLQDVLSGA